jgi:hypothetical protein
MRTASAVALRFVLSLHANEDRPAQTCPDVEKENEATGLV